MELVSFKESTACRLLNKSCEKLQFHINYTAISRKLYDIETTLHNLLQTTNKKSR